MIPCPCIKCINHRWHPTKIVYEHLVIYGMDPTYTNWVFHGENPISSTPIENRSTVFTMYKDADIGYHDNIEPDVEIRDEDLTHIVEDVVIPLYDGCSKYTKLSAIVVLYKHKATYGLSDKGFDELLGILRDMLSQDNVLPDSLYSTKKLLKTIDNTWPSFSSDSRNLRLGLAADRFNPYKNLSSTYSCWPNVYMGHRRFLPMNHTFQKNKIWFNGKEEMDEPPTILDDKQVRVACAEVENDWGKATNKKRKRKCHPIWKKNMMHIQKNICESLLGTLLNINGKTKDGVNSRKDLQDLGIRHELHIKDLKSHDCHVMMQQLLSVAICGLLPKGPRLAIFRLCSFFNDICQRVLDKSKLDSLEDEKSTQDSGVSIEAETVCTITGRDGSQVTKKMVYYGVLRKIFLVDYNQFRVPLFKCDWVSRNDVKVEDGFTLVHLHPRVNKYDRDPFILALQATQVFYSRETDTSSWYVVLKAPPRGFHDLEKFDEHAYMTSAPLDVSQLDSSMDDNEDYARIDCEDMMSTEGPSDTPSSSSKRKGRGPNQINFNKIAKAKEVGVTFNELGQPLGDSSIALSTCIGTITTQMIPITYSSWPEVPDVVKNSVWETMKARFGLDDVGKSNIFNSMNTCWRQYKTGRMIQLLKPTNITDEDWSQFVSNRLSSEFDIISSKYSDLVKKNKAPHTTSRKGLARLREDLRAKKSVESGDLEDTEVDKVETWIAGHKHKDGTPVTEDAGEIIKQLEEISGNQATSISNDVVSQVLGKEHRGRVKGLGGGVTPTRVNASVVGKQTTTQLREVMKKQNKKHEDEMKRQQDEMNALKQQLKDLQSFVFNMQQQYSSASNLSGGNKCLNIAGTSAKSFSKASTSHMDGSSEKEKKCKLLHWIGNGEVVAEAEVDCRDPQAVVHHMILGPDCWRVSVKKILVSKVPLYRATTEFMILEDTLNLFIAWPAKYVI
ncbi:hypothetical protein ACOSQ4_013370 [Xanthoceras sorbifolium]